VSKKTSVIQTSCHLLKGASKTLIPSEVRLLHFSTLGTGNLVGQPWWKRLNNTIQVKL